MFRKSVVSKVFDFIDSQGLVEPDDSILVGFSGGPDSVFLVTALNQYIERVRGSIICCHVHHGLRGSAASDDEAFVRLFAAEHGLPFSSVHVDVKARMREQHRSLEVAARELRLNALERERKRQGARSIALGHTADDAVETFLLNLLRGSGRKGLSGIQPKRSHIIRPLLAVTREEIISHLKCNRINYRVDATNWQSAFTRNFVRHELLPYIEKRMNRTVKSNILQLISIINGEEELLDRMTSEIFSSRCTVGRDGFSMSREDFKDLDTALQRRLIARCFSETVAGMKWLNFKEIEAIRASGTGKSSGVTFSYHGVRFLVGARSIMVAREIPEQQDSGEEVTIPMPGEVAFLGRYRIRTAIIDSVNGDMKSNDRAYFDLDKLAMPLTLRGRRHGDAFVPFGMEHEKKVKALLIDEKIPFWEREAIPVVSDAHRIIWVAGVRRSAHAPVNEKTKRVLKIEKRELG
jgi:tRNA(Ile)-lysidine synthase